MHRIWTHVRTAVALTGLAVAAQGWTQQSRPDPSLSVEDVVRAQLSGFAAGDEAGIARAFAFASPGNRAQTGPLPRFAAMIREGYPELLGHQSAELGPQRTDERHTYQAVDVIGPDGREHLYIFILGRYDTADCSACWMTDGVTRRPANPDARAL